MNFMKRALLSVKARKGKSLLQIFIFSVICVFVLSGLAIQSAATKSAELARQSLGGDVTLEFDMQKAMEEQRNEGGERVRIEREPIAVDEADELTAYSEIKGYNYFSTSVGLAGDFVPYEEDPSSEEEESTETGQGQGFQMRGGMMGDVTLQGVLYSDSLDEFTESTSTLVEGEHITDSEENQNIVLIEESLAYENDLAVGDSIEVQGINEEEETSVTLEIVGIYETTETTDDMGMSIAALDPANRLIVPFTAVNTLKGEDFAGTIDSAVYYVDDPKNIDPFIEQVEANSSIDFDVFNLNANDQLYQQMIGPITSVASFSENVVYLVTIAGAVILGLIVMISIRDRKFEMGVLLALGEKKGKLIGQFIVEILIIAMFALGISAVTGDLVANKMGEQLLTQQIESEDTTNEPASFAGMGRRGAQMMAQPEVDPLDELMIQITLSDFGLLAGIGILIAIISTLLPALTVLRLQPKTILTKQD
ncbi:ABC transporter permease [Bacillus spongiae]|uniref:ABC transporter permease n=1 Tax=Bacillus spongiae TaxID=2683610 RepID=A0ABU8HBM7_9BACI